MNLLLDKILYFLWSSLSLLIALVWRVSGKYGIQQRLCLDLGGNESQIDSEFIFDWFHSPSLGESKALVAWLKDHMDDDSCLLLTCQRWEALKILEDYAESREGMTVVRLAPLDHIPSLNRFFKTYKIARFSIYESDFWPLTMKRLLKDNVPLHWINARVHPSQKSKPQIYKTWVNHIWNRASITARSRSDQLRLKNFFDLNVDLGFDVKLNQDEPPWPPLNLSSSPSLALVSIHREELSRLDPYLAELNCSEVELYVLPRRLEDSEQIESKLKLFQWKSLNVIREFGQVQDTLALCNTAWVGGGLKSDPSVHNIFEVIYSPAILWLTGLEELHPWEDHLDEMKNFNLVNSWGDWSRSKEFPHSLTQYRSQLEKDFQKAQEVWNRIHL